MFHPDCCCGRPGRGRKCLGMALVVLAIAALLGLLVMVLWNCLVPSLFGLRALGYWQALGLLLLARILFGGIHPHRHPCGHRRRGPGRGWQDLTPEEQARVRRGFHGLFRCGDEKPPE